MFCGSPGLSGRRCLSISCVTYTWNPTVCRGSTVRHIYFSIYLSQIFTLRTLLNEVVTVERINETFCIEVKILRQQHSERMLDLCFCVKIHYNKKTN